MLSWCCFWISRDAVPARASLGITIILTAIVLCGSVNEAMPPVSYSKAQDYFLLVSFGFIFLSFLEFVIVLNTDPDPKWLQCLLACVRLRPKKVISPNFYINSTSFLALNHVLYQFAFISGSVLFLPANYIKFMFLFTTIPYICTNREENGH